MKIKKNLFVFMIFCICLFQVSCMSQKVIKTVFDPDRPASQSAKVLFWLDVHTYNGIDIHDTWGSAKDNIPLVTIPSGEAAFTFSANFIRETSDVIEYYTINECQFKYNFEGGKEYTVSWFLEKEPGMFFEVQEYKYYIKIYGRLPKNLKRSNNNDLKERDLLTTIFIFDTKDYRESLKTSVFRDLPLKNARFAAQRARNCKGTSKNNRFLEVPYNKNAS